MGDQQVAVGLDAQRVDTIVLDYLRQAEEAFKSKHADSIAALFLPNGYLRE